MEQHKNNASATDVQPLEIFARRCSLTGEWMNAGFCILDGDMYIKSEKMMVRHLRENFADIMEGHVDFDVDDYDISTDPEKMSDTELMEACYASDYFMYTEWTADDADEWDVILQKAMAMLEANEFIAHLDGNNIALTAWNNRLDLTTEVYLQKSEIESWADVYDDNMKDLQS